MQKINNIISNYNKYSDEKIDAESIKTIIPAMKLILNKVDFDDMKMLI